MTVSATFRIENTVVETLATNVQGVTSPQIIHDVYNQSLSLSGAGTGGTAIVTLGKAFQFTLTAGAFTIDLTSLPASGGGTFSATGLRLITFLATNPSTNAGSILVGIGAANGYTFLGALGKFTLALGMSIAWYSNNQGIDIDGTHKTIDLTGTGTDVLNCVLTFG